MDISHVLLNPKGRIGSRDFLRGLILLTAAGTILQVLAIAASPGAVVLQYPMLWAYFCVLGKRLHDAGQTAWFNLLFLFGYLVAATILNAVLVPVLSPHMMPLMTQIQEIGQKDGLGGMLQAQQEHALEIVRGTALPRLASFLLASAGLALVGARLPSDPDANAHGPATRHPDAS